jgi:hypothetical protein
MRRFRPLLRLSFVLALLAAGGTAPAADIAGVVRKASGGARVLRGGQASPAAPGMKLFPGDTVETDRDGAVGIVLRDDSRLAIGPGSSFSLDRFRFAPVAGELGLAARLSRGTIQYLSGLIGKLAPESVRIDTPVSSIGIRGTRFVLRSSPPGGR